MYKAIIEGEWGTPIYVNTWVVNKWQNSTVYCFSLMQTNGSKLYKNYTIIVQKLSKMSTFFSIRNKIK